MIKVTVSFLGPARDLAGEESAEIEFQQEATLSDVQARLAESYVGLARALGVIRLAVNDEFVSLSHKMRDGDEVLVIPPVSGGQDDERDLVGIVHETIDTASIRGHLSGDPALGGIVTFEGATRREQRPDGLVVERLEYEGHERMALAQLHRLARDARNRWGAERIAIVHRFGGVLPGEASVVIGVACTHRAEAFDACRWLIDELKKDVPIWKKDVLSDGSIEWVEGEKHLGAE